MAEKPVSRIHPELKKRAREFRRNPTHAEQYLWNFLRGRQLDGFKFRRQYVIGPFIADFYCPEKQLIIEIDGAAHAGQEEYDGYRTEWLNRHGLRVIRFINAEVDEQLEEVLSRIWFTLHEEKNENDDLA